LASPPTELKIHSFTAFDGVELAWREMGQGRVLVLLHGYISDAQTNWIRYGHGACLADAGFRVIMPDLRGHGSSAKPHDPQSYPKDVLASDGLALIDHLGLSDFDLGGYSLGGRTTARMLARGCKPRRAIISGMGLSGLTNTSARVAHFQAIFDGLGHHTKASPEWMAEMFLKTTDGDPVALARVLHTNVDTPAADIRALNLPVGVICGSDDDDNGSAADLAELLPQGSLHLVRGNHMSAVAKPDLGQKMADYLTA
jgi:pimeloyl-ACP methyl ester carboxylesterase